VAGAADTFLKVSVAASLLVAAGSIGYYYSIYLPNRDAHLDGERRLEKLRAEFARKSADERARAEREAAEQKLALEKAETQARYESCIDREQRSYDLNWASTCKRLAEKARKDRASCNLPPATCDSIHPARDPTAACALPQSLASTVNADLERGKNRCLQESKAGLQ
jgi:hypothetical protein